MKKALLTTISIIALSSPSVASNPTCTNPDGEPGVIFFNSLHGVFQGCTPNGWYAFHAPGCPQADACDAPGAFAFAENTNVPLSSLVLSDIVQISDLDRSASITISGDGSPEYRICDASDCSSEVIAWGSSQTSIEDSQYLQLRLTSSDTEATMLSATATVNGVGARWDVTTEAAGPSPPATCPNIGDLCSDGTVYAGLSPVGFMPMFTTAADSPTALAWGSGGIVRGTTNFITGEANTATLAALGPSAHPAAQYCDSLNVHSHSDWYLPARDELGVLYTNKNVGALNGSFNETGTFPDGWYWSSSEADGSNAGGQRFSSGFQSMTLLKNTTRSVRCVRG